MVQAITKMYQLTSLRQPKLVMDYTAIPAQATRAEELIVSILASSLSLRATSRLGKPVQIIWPLFSSNSINSNSLTRLMPLLPTDTVTGSKWAAYQGSPTRAPLSSSCIRTCLWPSSINLIYRALSSQVCNNINK